MLLYILNLSIFIPMNQWVHVWYHTSCEWFPYPNILPLFLGYFHILRYNASNRGRDFWDTMYLARLKFVDEILIKRNIIYP